MAACLLPVARDPQPPGCCLLRSSAERTTLHTPAGCIMLQSGSRLLPANDRCIHPEWATRGFRTAGQGPGCCLRSGGRAGHHHRRPQRGSGIRPGGGGGLGGAWSWVAVDALTPRHTQVTMASTLEQGCHWPTHCRHALPAGVCGSRLHRPGPGHRRCPGLRQRCGLRSGLRPGRGLWRLRQHRQGGCHCL